MFLTVVIVTKNPGTDIYQTLSSVLPLNDSSVEILIKDNSDKQDLKEINKCFQFTNFRYVHSDDNGVYDAMNQAIDLAKGKYLYFLNAGDTYIDCNLLERLQTGDSDADFYYGNIINLHPFARQISYSKYINKYTVYIRRVCHQAIIVKKEIFNKIGLFDTNLKVNADYLFILQLFDKYQGKALNRLITIYKGGGLSYGYKQTTTERNHLKRELKKFYNPVELLFLAIASSIFSVFIYLKNINKPT